MSDDVLSLPDHCTRLSVEAHGDLVISSWRGPGVQVDADGGTYDLLEMRGEAFAVVFHDAAEISLPPGVALELTYAAGDVEVDDLTERLVFQHILGDLSLENVVGGEVASVSGDFSAAHVTGDLLVRNVSGCFEAEDVAGGLTVDNVGGDVELDGVRGSTSIGNTGGDFTASGVQGALQVSQHILGDLSLENVAGAAIASVNGDCSAVHVTGDLLVRNVSGDFDAEDVAGGLTVDNVSGCVELDGVGGSVTVRSTGGDFTARDVQGSLQLNNAGGDLDITAAAVSGHFRTGGDATIVLQGPDLQAFQVEAGGDIDLQIPAGSGANLSMKSGSRTMELRLGGETELVEKHSAEVTLGGGGPEIRLRCGGDITVSDPTPRGKGKNRPQIDFSFKINDEVNRRTQQKVEQAQQKADEAMRRLDIKMSGMGSEIDAAVKAGLAGSGFDVPDPFVPARGRTARPAPASEPVTDEERMLILQMVQDKKISVEEAEKLLEALDGKA